MVVIIEHNNKILKDAFNAVVIHERNGRLDISFTIPNTIKINKFDEIKTEIPYMGMQIFYVTDIVKKQGFIDIFAKHVFFKIGKNVSSIIKSQNVTGQAVLDLFKNSLVVPSKFNFTSNITDKRQFNTTEYTNSLSTLAEGKHSILGQWGGTLVYDNYDIKLMKRFGRDTEYIIAKRKNINDLEITENSDEVITRLIITKKLEDETIIEATVDSPLINEYPDVFIEHRETTDETVQNKDDLVKYAEDIFRLQRIDLPKESFEVDTFAENYEFTIDDTAIIYYEDYNLDKRVTVTSYEYNPISKRYLKVNFGDETKSLLKATTDKASDIIDRDLIKPNMSYVDKVFEEIRESLKDPTGGIILEVKDNEGNVIELLIMDNADINKAKHIWRWNINGLSHSSNGVNGSFDVAITQGGQIVADFITAGVLNAELLRAGIIKSHSGNTWWDLDTGYININDELIYNKNGLKIMINGKNLNDKLQDFTTKEEFESLNIDGRNLVSNLESNWELGGIDNSGQLVSNANAKRTKEFSKNQSGMLNISTLNNYKFYVYLYDNARVFRKRITKSEVVQSGYFKVMVQRDKLDHAGLTGYTYSELEKYTHAYLSGSLIIEDLFLKIENSDKITGFTLSPEDVFLQSNQTRAMIDILKDNINIKFESGEFPLKGKNYNFNIDNFSIGGASENVAYHDENQSKWVHADGSYTQVSAKGLMRYDSESENEYHYMTKVIEFDMGGTGVKPSNRWIGIGSEFNNKKWKVSLSLSDTVNPPNNLYSLHRIVFTQGHDGSTVLEPWFDEKTNQWKYPVMGYTMYLDQTLDKRYWGGVAGIMIVTA